MTTARAQSWQMSPLDALMFRGDEHPRTLSVVGALFMFDGPLPRRRLVDVLVHASERFPRLRQRPITPPLRMLLPQWADDPNFDVQEHVRQIAVVAPGSLAETLDVIRTELAAPFETDRPLWDAVSLTGLADGRGALFFRMSHAVTDGQGALRLFDALFGAGSARSRRRARVPTPEPLPDPRAVQVEALARLPEQALKYATQQLPGLFAFARDALRDPVTFAGTAEKYLASARRVLTPPCPPAPALAARSFERRCAVLTLSLTRLKRAARRFGATVNDLYLAAITDALRRYQLALGIEPQDVRLAVPVDLRRGSEEAAGNYIGALNLVAPASEPDPTQRVVAIHEAMAAGRAEPGIAAPSMVAPLLARMPDVAFERLVESIPRADVQASNVRGPSERPVLAGRRVLAVYPFGPVPGVAAMFAMLSLGDECFAAVHFDPASFVKPETFAECIQRGFAEVLAAGGQPATVDPPVLDHGPIPIRAARRAGRHDVRKNPSRGSSRGQTQRRL